MKREISKEGKDTLKDGETIARLTEHSLIQNTSVVVGAYMRDIGGELEADTNLAVLRLACLSSQQASIVLALFSTRGRPRKQRSIEPFICGGDPKCARTMTEGLGAKGRANRISVLTLRRGRATQGEAMAYALELGPSAKSPTRRPKVGKTLHFAA